jgi:hypothetical protein
VLRFLNTECSGLHKFDWVQVSDDSYKAVKYLIAGDDENKVCYVAIRGTVNLDDVLTDLNLIPALGNDGRCHTGFFSAAQHIPLEKLRDCVKDEGWKLRFCGHSLGGAVAKLLTLRLLATNAAKTSICAEPGNVLCITFAAPYVGNKDVARYVARHNWKHVFHNFVRDGDPVPGLLNLTATCAALTKKGTEVVEALVPPFRMLSTLWNPQHVTPGQDLPTNVSLFATAVKGIVTAAVQVLPDYCPFGNYYIIFAVDHVRIEHFDCAYPSDAEAVEKAIAPSDIHFTLDIINKHSIWGSYQDCLSQVYPRMEQSTNRPNQLRFGKSFSPVVESIHIVHVDRKEASALPEGSISADKVVTITIKGDGLQSLTGE